MNIGTLGHLDHGKTTLTAAITMALAEQAAQTDEQLLQHFENEDPEAGELLEEFCRKRPLKGKGYLTPEGIKDRLGRLVNPLAPGRNDPCDCGSGKKYKKCCMP